MKNKKQAFTLIELLIVIAIVGILASVTLVSLTSARIKARETEYINFATQMARIAEAAFSAGYLDEPPGTGNMAYWACLGIYPNGRCVFPNSSFQNVSVNGKLSNLVNPIPQGLKSPYCNENEVCGVYFYYHYVPAQADPWYGVVGMIISKDPSEPIAASICQKIGWDLRSYAENPLPTGSYCQKNIF